MNHKYGFHVNQTGGSKGNEVLDAVRRIRPKVVKVLDPDVDFCKKVRDLVPDVFLIGRVVISPASRTALRWRRPRRGASSPSACSTTRPAKPSTTASCC